MSSMQFGGALAPVHEPSLGRPITLRCFGELELAIQDPAAFEQATASSGGIEGFSAWVKVAVLKHASAVVEERMAAGTALLAVIGKIAPLVEGIEQQTNAALAGVGATVRVASLNVNLSEDDRDAMIAVAAKAAAANRER